LKGSRERINTVFCTKGGKQRKHAKRRSHPKGETRRIVPGRFRGKKGLGRDHLSGLACCGRGGGGARAGRKNTGSSKEGQKTESEAFPGHVERWRVKCPNNPHSAGGRTKGGMRPTNPKKKTNKRARTRSNIAEVHV